MYLNSALKSSARVQVEAHWEPIADSMFNLHKEFSEHAELFDLSPDYPIKEYEADAFKAFLPSSSVVVGDVWELDSDGVVQFLRQFHPRGQQQLYFMARKVPSRAYVPFRQSMRKLLSEFMRISRCRVSRMKNGGVQIR